MNWYRSVKTLYIFTFNIFYFIIWAILSNNAIRIKPDYGILLLGLGSCLMMEYIGAKMIDSNSKLKRLYVFGIPFVSAFLFILLMFGDLDNRVNIVYIAAVLLLCSRMESDYIVYDSYVKKVKAAIITLIAMGIFLLNTTMDTRAFILKLYILFLISSVWLLREARRYSYNIKLKGSWKRDLLVMSAVALISSEWIASYLGLALKFLWSNFIYLIIKSLEIIFKYLGWIVERIYRALFQSFRGTGESSGSNENFQDPYEELHAALENIEAKMPPWLVVMIALIMASIIICVVYKIVKNYKKSYLYTDSQVEEERERIITSKVRSLPLDFIKGFIYERDAKSQIRSVYQGFQKRAFRKNIYSGHMTATQLKNVTKAQIDNFQALEDLTDIYNEAKFSGHHITDEELKKAKTAFYEIKKQL
jgi:hypothetical protein